ncbi:Crp/Fnr family transcriptional regulator [Chryseolinea lacunae]|uniref:Cyclic nucleotide-binding domain-containing protein n=1 Tax=Chryseolinea lacunae TaxID=2801331 RepID=A0ABS1KLU8_9BACT|nr:cyclic nucleotide-binding domain-containing protein [Chryseolinea lacunae]MBL0740444.1 cyclic nucleotide-binding domain-containing protein [Chryseolinea lacunae]
MKNILLTYLQRFGSLSEEDQEIILEAFRQETVREGDYLFEGGHVCKEMFFVCRGVLKIVMVREQGERVVHYFLKQNQFCTILQSFKQGVVAEEHIQAACDGDVLRITKAELQKLYEKIPYLEGRIEHIIQQGLLDKVKLRNLYLGHPSLERYALFMEHQADIARQVSLADVAAYLGVTQQSLSRIRRNFK